MSNKKPSNYRLSKRAKLALKAKGKQYKRYRKGPVKTAAISNKVISKTINPYSIEG